MSQFRLVALLLVTAAGCYKEAPESTFPEPSYFAGPPGGSMDPAGSYQEPGEPAYETDEPRTPRPAPVATAPDLVPPDDGDEASDQGDAPVPEAEYTDPDVDTDQNLAEAPAPDDATAQVTDTEIQSTLGGYGQWIDTPDYGPIWRPDATVVGVDFTPYETAGSWAYTDAGWAFYSDYSWGWLPFHYGRWGWFHDYWAWVPGYAWSPACVEWRYGNGVVGWRPLRPQIRDHRHSSGLRDGVVVRDHRRPRLHTAHWRFAAERDFSRPRIRSHLYGNLAEGLRVTSRVNAPPLRARATVRPGELMRNRFVTGRSIPSGTPGRYGSPQIRDHRAYSPSYRPSVRTQTYDAPRTYQPPARSAPPVRMVQPPARTYQPPARTYQPPARGYEPPARTYEPPARSAPPVRMHQPPPRSYQSPPVRTYTPPARSYTPPARSYTPPTRSYTPPARSYTPPARSYTPPARSYTPPARSSNASSTSSPPERSSGSSHRGRHR